ncbi:MAG: CCA tRNA nucleotidyltransferase [Pirellula sp.]|nr:CCA tRNA nucleotidyltransferase [Pirellula sp.]
MYNVKSVDFQFAEQVVRQLVNAGHIAYFAGGCVRDAILGNEPHDFDIATDATTEEVRATFGNAHTRAVGEAFGVVLVHQRIKGKNCQVEVATFRTDGSYSDGRRPDWVALATPEEDARRRDFTINGLFYDPLKGQVIDYVGGQADLENRIVRAIGVAADRFNEDKLRLLRAIRFAGRFGFTLDSDTQSAIQQSSPGIASVSGERIGVEIKKMLEHPSRAWAWTKLIETGLTRFLFPELDHRWTHAGDRHRDLLVLQNLPRLHVDWTSSIGALVLPWYIEHRSEDALDTLLMALKQHWKISNIDLECLAFAIRNAEVFVDATHRPWSQIQPLMVCRFARPALDLAEALAKALSQPLNGVQFCRTQVQLPEHILNPVPFLHGGDLIAQGLKPGPLFTRLLSEARALQLDSHLLHREAALAWLAEAVRHVSNS